MVEDIWNTIHEVAQQIEETLTYEGEPESDEAAYQREIQPLRDFISALNQPILSAIKTILELYT